MDRSTITRVAHEIRPLLAAGPAKQVPDQVQAAPLNSKKDAPPETLAAWGAARHQQPSVRICVQESTAGHKQWPALLRYLGRREYVDEGYSGVAGLVSDRTATR
ncbi:transposase [Streptomyces sp. NPDC060322]|uniref:transposase n=1 Tax=Streptomyces sp. NPDC060322 TaxID=3347097 RepID=UPI00364CD3F4